MKNNTTPNYRGIITYAFLTILSVSIFSGCSSSRGLDPRGPYNGDEYLFNVDRMLDEVDRAFEDILGIAERNPWTLATNDDFAKLVDKVKTEGRDAMRDALIARNTYAKSFSGLDYSDLEDQIEIVRNIRNLVLQYLARQALEELSKPPPEASTQNTHSTQTQLKEAA